MPQQITSQARNQLKKPITLDIVRDGNAIDITDARVNITDVKDHVATWDGSGFVGNVRVRVSGTLEYK